MAQDAEVTATLWLHSHGPRILQPNPGLINSCADRCRGLAGEHYRLRLAGILDSIRGVLWGKKCLGGFAVSKDSLPPQERSRHTGLLPLPFPEIPCWRHFTVLTRLQQTFGAPQGGREKNSLEFAELQKVSASWLGLEAMLQAEAPWGLGFATG